MQNYSIFNLARHALKGHLGWNRNFGGRPLRKHYDVVIVGGGGHGLATAYYLAKNHGITTWLSWSVDGWVAAIPAVTQP